MVITIKKINDEGKVIEESVHESFAFLRDSYDHCFVFTKKGPIEFDLGFNDQLYIVDLK